MSTPIKDGGPAFPYPADHTRNGNNGMTLRDYFAAQALPQLVRTALDLDHEKWDATAQHAYWIADAMLKERAKCPTNP